MPRARAPGEPGQNFRVTAQDEIELVLRQYVQHHGLSGLIICLHFDFVVFLSSSVKDSEISIKVLNILIFLLNSILTASIFIFIGSIERAVPIASCKASSILAYVCRN